METKQFLLMILCVFFIGSTAFAERQLDRSEILEILQDLTSKSQKTWISAGTIRATHHEYRASETTNQSVISAEISDAINDYQNNPGKRELTEEWQKMALDAIPFNIRYRLSNEYTMNSTVVVKFDGTRFYWDIDVTSRSDSVKPKALLEANYMTKEFNLEWNTKRVFAWDGQKYTVYSPSTNNAMVDTTGSIPHVVNGPLTAGIIPWGYGHYTYKNLSSARSSAVEEYINGRTQIQLTLTNSDGAEMSFVLDVDNDYAVISHSIEGSDKNIYRQYDNYKSVSGVMVPMTILIEQYDAFTNKLLASDSWNFTSVSGSTPSVGEFIVDYEPDTQIGYRSYLTDKPTRYRYSYTVDSEQLLTQRLDYAASETIQARNCASAALKYSASQLGKKLSYEQLSELVGKSDGSTSLKAMKDFVRRCGFYCRVVQTDIRTLKDLRDCQVILHFPGKNHFVALQEIDNEYAWLVDLSKDKCYYRTDLNFFDMDWSEGTALVISNRPIRLNGNSTDISERRLDNIKGGLGYSCTNKLQEYDVVYCEYPIGGLCDGYYEVYFNLYGCESAQSGSCVDDWMDWMWESPCIVDPYDPSDCTITGDWNIYYTLACNY